MRVALALMLMLPAHPAEAWLFTPLPVCTIVNEAEPDVRVTYDGSLYTITLSRRGGWPQSPVFALRFEGPRMMTISTTRHRILGEDLVVSDRGFGNVLDGMQFSPRATALIGELALPIDLRGAAGPVEAFRACDPGPSA